VSSHAAPLSTPEGPGSVSGAPNLPAGFADTFTSRYIETGALRRHAVLGGEGPPLLLVHGWPETWYAWRLLMPALARDFTIIAVDQRGIGLTDKPDDGYDTGTLAGDLVALIDALGHERFAVVGHDTGFIISYALAADNPDRVDRVALAEIPGPPPPLPHRHCSSPDRSTTGSGTSPSTASTSCPNSSSADVKTSSSAMSSPSRAGTCLMR
jgi:pimeloyl-ACP methyl ester carboxylesterase